MRQTRRTSYLQERCCRTGPGPTIAEGPSPARDPIVSSAGHAYHAGPASGRCSHPAAHSPDRLEDVPVCCARSARGISPPAHEGAPVASPSPPIGLGNKDGGWFEIQAIDRCRMRPDNGCLTWHENGGWGSRCSPTMIPCRCMPTRKGTKSSSRRTQGQTAQGEQQERSELLFR